MSTKSSTEVAGSWERLTVHDWNDGQAFETTLCNALQHLDCSIKDSVLYDYIDLEATIDAFSPEEPERGVSEVRFDLEDYELRILQDGTIAARKRQGTAQVV